MRTATRFSAEAKAELLALVTRTQARTGWTAWTVRRILPRLGLTMARYRAWTVRAGRDARTDRSTAATAADGILPEERAAVRVYALAHPKDGYRRLAWQMIDADVAYPAPASVYRVLRAADMLSRWHRSARSGEAPAKPTRAHERWHTVLMYLRIGDAWYFQVSVLDASSRNVVHRELLTTMTAADVRRVIQQALEVNGAQPKLVTDNSSPFTAAKFRDLVRRFAVEHIRIRTYHPESNGLVERFHRSTREALAEAELRALGRARTLIAAWVLEYNRRRLHAGPGHLRPADFYRGDPAARWRERTEQLDLPHAERRRLNDARLDDARLDAVA